ncbi:nitronate monooxygenase [Proteobacteria bacterium 005FR1]|nr:nitronate monooxygenase [Proteobacteria bacterium 005FR1]
MKLLDLLNTRFPIIQAPMAGVQDNALTVAVCKAGGLGSLPCGMLSPDAMRREIEAIRQQTDASFNLNFFCHQTPSADLHAEESWRAALTPYYHEYGIDPQSIGAGASRTPFNEAAAEIVEAYRPAVVSFHFGLPAAALLERVKAAGSAVLSSATTVDEALWLEAHGADAIIAQGFEAGGHRGMFLSDDLSTQVGTFALLPQIVDAVKLPVIAAGGIADARGVRAAMDLGAAGVQVGTAYLLCPEARTSDIHRSALKAGKGGRGQYTVVTNVFSGRPARGIVNRLISDLGPVSDLAPAFPLAASAIAPLRSAAETRGRCDFSPLWAGQNAAGVREVPAGELTSELSSGLPR